jgi:hypothetical protein
VLQDELLWFLNGLDGLLYRWVMSAICLTHGVKFTRFTTKEVKENYLLVRKSVVQNVQHFYYQLRFRLFCNE